MALISSTSYVLLTPDLAPSLPDPATTGPRTHSLVNSGTGPASWTSSGSATPFLVDGVSSASLTVARGSARMVYSDGTQWVSVSPSVPQRRIFAGTGVSDASGNVTYTFTPAFPAAPVVTHAVQTTDPDATEARVTSLSASGCTVNVRQSPGVVVLGLSVLQVPQPLVGATVHLMATASGQI